MWALALYVTPIRSMVNLPLLMKSLFTWFEEKVTLAVEVQGAKLSLKSKLISPPATTCGSQREAPLLTFLFPFCPN